MEAAEERALAALWQASLEEVGRLTDAEWESPARRRQGLAAWYAVLRDVAPVLDRLGVAGIVLPPQPAA